MNVPRQHRSAPPKGQRRRRRDALTGRAGSRGDAKRWVPVGAAGLLLAGVIGIGLLGGDDNSNADEGVTSVSIVAASAPVELTTPTGPTAVPIDKIPISSALSSGMVSDEVEMVQQRLLEIGFDPGPPDGHYGSYTEQAVWAYEKLIVGVPRNEATGIVTPELWDRMQEPLGLEPRADQGDVAHVEIYLPEQVMAVFDAGQPTLIAHVSTGELWPNATGFKLADAAEYCGVVTIDTDDRGVPLDEPYEEAQCGRSYTPPGVFEAYRQIEGRRESRLGGMYDPIYINQGIAIHGAENIPLYPASHGCIRVNRFLGEKLQAESIIEIGDRVLIWDGDLDPWEQPKEAMKMRWDYPDPTATTTTTTTMPSTTMPSTTGPTTTVVPSAAPSVIANTAVPTTTTPTTVPSSSTDTPSIP